MSDSSRAPAVTFQNNPQYPNKMKTRNKGKRQRKNTTKPMNKSSTDVMKEGKKLERSRQERQLEARTLAEELGLEIGDGSCTVCAEYLYCTILQYRHAGKVFEHLHGVGESKFRNCGAELQGSCAYKGHFYFIDESLYIQKSDKSR